MRRKLFALLAIAGAVLLAAAGGASGQQGVGAIITRQVFESMLSHRGDSGCQGAFYTYDAFVNAAARFPAFGTTGDAQTRRRELAAFFGQTSHETTGGWPTAPGGTFAWGYCRVEEQKQTDPPYYGRGPIQLTHKYNYDLAGKALKLDLVGKPSLVSSDPVVAFETAIWFWMTPQAAKPSCHDVITGRWTPGAGDRAAGRLAGYGLLTNIINGGLECGKGGQPTDGDSNRVGFYRRYCKMLGVAEGANLNCQNQKPYAPAG
ncbi:hypothetical protein HU200_001637 [Digitaria exilis]|uniref:chitinase n=1 Tax=Digitaria exilis TaxID=1010633 RepID=A0A835G0D6_9POAL|nr:hypothetical protein HU200_001637 [Digitaria exilis]